MTTPVSTKLSTTTKENTMTNKILRQGDVLIVGIDKLPKCTKIKDENGLYILAYGEATGHHHSIRASKQITMFREDGAGGGLCFTVTEPVVLEHQEHSALTIQRGHYEVRRQRTMQSGLVRRVAD